MKQKLQLLIVLFLLSLGSAFAQSIQVLMSPKPSPYISDWQQQNETVKLIISNTTQSVIIVKIKSELFDGTGSVIAATDAAKMPELEVSPGVSTYDAGDVFPLQAISYKGKGEKITAQTGRIPDDNYKLCVALTEPQGGAILGTSGTVCKAFSITAFQAPTLINPVKNQEIAETGVKGIVFRWTPIVPKPKDLVTYRLQVWEVLEGQTSMIALRTNQPVVEKDCKEILQTQWPIDNALPEAGKKYVWTITPLDGEGRKLVDGIGFAEPFSFSVLANISKVTPIALLSPESGSKIKLNESKTISFRWTPIVPKPKDLVSYRLQVWEVLQGQTSMIALRTNKPIVSKDIADITEFSAETNIFCHPPEKPCPGQLVWRVEALDAKGAVLSVSELNEFQLISSSSVCFCNPWPSVLRVEVTNSSGGIISSSNQPNGGTVTLSAGQNINIPSFAAPCQNGCSPIIKYSLYYSNGVAVYTNYNSGYQAGLLELPCDTGKYKLVISLTCGTTACTDYIVFINKPCAPPVGCACGNWGKLYVNTVFKTCNSATTVNCNTPVTFNNTYTCSPTSANCPAVINWKVRGPAGYTGTIAGSGSGATFSGTFTPTVNGTYLVTLYGLCNGKLCDSCKFEINVTNCPSLCNCGNWGKLYVNTVFKTCNAVITGKCNVPVNFTNTYTCNPSTPTCPAIINWKVKGPGTFSASGTGSGSSFSGSFTPVANGTYTATMYGLCNGKICDSCIFYVRILDCKICSNCTQVNITPHIITSAPSLLNISGNISSPSANPITKIMAVLESFAANNTGSVIQPKPNFEFIIPTSAIAGIPALAPFSLSGSGSNMLVSNFTAPATSVAYIFSIDNMTNKVKVSGRIKLTIFRADGTYCEHIINL